MKKQLLFILPAFLIIGSVVSVSADEGVQSIEAVTTSVKSVSLERQALQEKARLTREENKQMRSNSKDARKDFRTANTGAILDMKNELSEEAKIAIKKAHDERREYVASLSGMTLEQKAQYMSGMEDKIRHEIETRFANATGALQTKRMEVYEQNAARRAEMVANQLELRAARGTLRTTEIDAMIAKITVELPNLSTERKTKLAKKIDERIIKIQANKKLPEVSKTEIVTKLTALKTEILK